MVLLTFYFKDTFLGAKPRDLMAMVEPRLNSTGCECVHGQVMSGFLTGQVMSGFLTRQSVAKEMHSSFLVGLGYWIFSLEDISDAALACGSAVDQTLFQNEGEKSSTVK